MYQATLNKKNTPRKGWTLLDKKNIPDILRLRKEGWIYTDIAEKYNVSATTIAKVCLQNNVKHPSGNHPTYFWTEERQKTLAKMWNDGVSSTDIAVFFNKTESAILAHICQLRSRGWDIISRRKTVRYVRHSGVYYIPRGC